MSTTIIPVVVSSHHSEPSRCPGCDRIEDTKLVCRHCNYEYAESTGGCLDTILMIFTFCFILWAAATIVIWCIDGGDNTLLHFLKLQWEWVLNKLSKLW